MTLIKDNLLPPLRWKMGRVVKIHPSPDGIPRALTLQNPNRIIVHAANKVSLLSNQIES